MTTKLRIISINLMKLIKNNKKYAKKIGVDAKMKDQNNRKRNNFSL